MKAIKPTLFDFLYKGTGKTDIGVRRQNNQDEIVLCPELGFFAVSDGMGGLTYGKLAAEFVVKTIPGLMEMSGNEFKIHKDVNKAAAAFQTSVVMMSDNLYEAANTEKLISYGATFVGVWFIKYTAIFCCLGDSRGYLLSKYQKRIRQITEDQNIGAILVKNGELTPLQAKEHPASSRLTAFVGMKSPATPQVFIVDVKPGDRLLLCSDGLYGMVSDGDITHIVRSSRSPQRVCQRLIDKANKNGGRDNISAVYVRIM